MRQFTFLNGRLEPPARVSANADVAIASGEADDTEGSFSGEGLGLLAERKYFNAADAKRESPSSNGSRSSSDLSREDPVCRVLFTATQKPMRPVSIAVASGAFAFASCTDGSLARFSFSAAGASLVSALPPAEGSAVADRGLALHPFFAANRLHSNNERAMGALALFGRALRFRDILDEEEKAQERGEDRLLWAMRIVALLPVTRAAFSDFRPNAAASQSLI